MINESNPVVRDGIRLSYEFGSIPLRARMRRSVGERKGM